MLKTAEQIEADNEAWWLIKASDYPHTAVSPLEGEAPADFPEDLWKPFGRFVVIPLPSSKQLRWGFKNKAARDAFIAAVGKGLLPVKAAMESGSGPAPDPFDFL